MVAVRGYGSVGYRKAAGKGTGSLKKKQPAAKPHNFYGVGQGKQYSGAGSKTYTPAPRKPKVTKRGRSMGVITRDVYGSGSGGGGGYGRGGGGGGYRGYNSQADYYAAQQAAAEKQRQAQLEAARKQAKEELNTRMAMIDAAIRSAKGTYATNVAGLERRHQDARGELEGLYGGLYGNVQSLGNSAVGALDQAGNAAVQGDQSVANAIAGRNNETEAGLAAALNAMGLGKGLQQDQAQASEEMALAEMQALSNVGNTRSNYGLMEAAQRAVSNWDLSGVKQDQARGISDLNYQVRDELFGLRELLAQLLGDQEKEKIAAQGDYRAAIAGLNY